MRAGMVDKITYQVTTQNYRVVVAAAVVPPGVVTPAPGVVIPPVVVPAGVVIQAPIVVVP